MASMAREIVCPGGVKLRVPVGVAALEAAGALRGREGGQGGEECGLASVLAYSLERGEVYLGSAYQRCSACSRRIKVIKRE